MIHNNNFLQVVPDSHWFTSLDQILNYSQGIQDKYLEIGIKNSIDKGFIMLPLNEVKDETNN